MFRTMVLSVTALLYGSVALAQSATSSYSSSSKPTAAAPTVAEVKSPTTPQQQRMINCNAEAGTRRLRDDARSEFMRICLSAAAPAKADTPPERMKICNVRAGEQKLEGDARRNFMSSCLKSG